MQAQEKNAPDSLNILLKENVEDTAQVNLFNKLASQYSSSDLPKTKKYAEKALELAQKLNYPEGIAVSYRLLGIFYYLIGDYSEALTYSLKALKIADSIQNKELISKCYNNISIIYIEQKVYEKALYYLTKSLKIDEATKNSEGIAIILNNIGEVYTAQKKYEKALGYYLKSLEIATKTETETGKISVATALLNIGNVKEKMGHEQEALNYYKQSKAFSQKIHDEEGILLTNKAIAENFLKKGKTEEALQYAEESLALALKLRMNAYTRDVYETLTKIHEQKKDFKTAFQYFRLFESLKDSLFNEESSRKITQMQATLTLEDTEKEFEILKKDQLIKDATIKRQNFAFTAIGAVFILVLSLMIIYYRASKHRKKVNRILKKQKEEITKQAARLQLKNQKINLQKERLVELNQIKGKLLSIISHDFRSPLNSIQGTLDLLSEENLSLTDLKTIAIGLKDKVDNTLDLLDNLLHWAKNQIEGVEVHPEAINLQEISQNNLQLLKPQADKKQIMLKNNIQKALQVNADYDMISLVVRNLLSNAIKYTSKDDQIVIEAQQKTDKTGFVQISVADTGLGISPSVKEQLFNFNSFYSETGTANEKGTGLGLMLCKDFVEKNGGEIWVESEEGKGSVFYFTLPEVP